MLYHIKHFFRRIKNIIKWIPVIWETYDWDCYYSIEVFKFHLQQVQKRLEEDEFGVDSKNISIRLAMILKLMDRVYSNYYLFEVLDEFEEKYGKFEWVRNPIEVDGEIVYSIEDTMPEELDKIHTEYVIRAHEKEKRAHKLLWELIEHNIQGW